MNRRTLVATLGAATVATAGCVADNAGDADEDPVVAHFDGEPARPECEVESETVEVEYDGETREYETAATVPYPDPPTAFARDDVVDYVTAFERAYVTHDVLCDRYGSGHVFDVEYGVREHETFDWYDEITVVFLLRAGGAVSGTDGSGRVWVADIAYGGVVYAIDETGVARTDFDDASGLDRGEFESHAPDPLDDGDLVAAFE